MRAIAAITADMARPQQMHRLLQGDVGSGKTNVAFYAMLAAISNGHQAALMAPTGVLPDQHYEGAKRAFEPLGIRVGRLTGRIRGRKRKRQKSWQGSPQARFNAWSVPMPLLKSRCNFNR